MATVPVTDEICDTFHTDPARVAVIQASLPTGATLEALSETFKALGDPTRLRMLTALAEAELCVCDLATLVGISESAASHQLRLLRTLRLVRSRRDGRMVHYRLDDDHITGLLAQGLDHVNEAGTRRER
ncbi:MAG: helix-turn-helix transcriptional regulator [Vicinamibacteria bacterium]|nr:helix-turn-helix transcriptional regulator [Vicinamibacteria bacterium]